MLRPVSELNGWDHDVGFNTFQVEKASALFSSKRLPAYFNAQVSTILHHLCWFWARSNTK